MPRVNNPQVASPSLLRCALVVGVCVVLAAPWLAHRAVYAEPGQAGSASSPTAERLEGGVRSPPPRLAEAPRAEPQPLVMEAVIDSAFVGPQHVVYVLPPDYESSGRSYPAVMAFAGLGESVRGNKAGAWGWVEKYGVVPAMAALHRGTPLTSGDFQGLIKGEALDPYHEVLAKNPYQGVILVCPYPPNVLRGRTQRPDYERYLIEELIPYTRRHLRVPKDSAGWGVDGISLGGLLSTYVGFKYVEHFAAIGSQQGSINSRAALIDRLRDEHLDQLRTRRLNVATSTQDGFREGLRAFSQRLERAGVPHRFTILPGRHDKRFVKGPGSIELLLFHDRALNHNGAMPSD